MHLPSQGPPSGDDSNPSRASLPGWSVYVSHTSLDGFAAEELAIPECTREDRWLTLSSAERTYYDHSEGDFLSLLRCVNADSKSDKTEK